MQRTHLDGSLVSMTLYYWWVLTAYSLILGFICYYIIPKFKAIFEDFGDEESHGDHRDRFAHLDPPQCPMISHAIDAERQCVERVGQMPRPGGGRHSFGLRARHESFIPQ